MSQELKNTLLDLCRAIVQQRISAAIEAMDSAQEAANENTKSSAGDKYETDRAMMQIERDKAAAHLETALALKKDLEAASSLPSPTIVQGSLVRTSNGWFLISAAIGKLSQGGTDYWAISQHSPVGKLLMGKAEGDKVSFNGREFEVLELH